MTATLEPCLDPATDGALVALRATIDVGLARHRAADVADAPKRAAINAALKQLQAMGAVDDPDEGDTVELEPVPGVNLTKPSGDVLMAQS